METNIRCSCCGASEITQLEEKGLGVCAHCGATIIMPKANEEVVSLLNTAYLQRANYDFDAAIKTYEFAISKDKNEKSAYEGLLLAKYGIEYVKDPRSNTLVPTCHRTHFSSIYEDDTYKTLLSLCDAEEKKSLKSKVEKIEKLQQSISKQLEKEEDYDVFISYKATDPNGDRTEDSIIARNIYDQLTKYGYKVFLAEKTLESRLGSDYEPIIFKAIHTSEIFILVGTKKEYINSVWVKNEWTRFIDRIRVEDELSARSFIPVFKDMSPNDMPTINNKYAQGVDASKLGYEITVADGVSKYIKPKKEEPAYTFKPREPEEELDIYQRRKLRREQAFNEKFERKKKAFEEKFERKKTKRQIAKEKMQRLKEENKKAYIKIRLLEAFTFAIPLLMIFVSLITRARFINYFEFGIYAGLILAFFIVAIITAIIKKNYGVSRLNFNRVVPIMLCIISLSFYSYLAYDAFKSYSAAGSFAGGYYTIQNGYVSTLYSPSSNNNPFLFFGHNSKNKLIIPEYIDGRLVDLTEIYSYDRVREISYINTNKSCKQEKLDLYLRCDNMYLETLHKDVTLYSGFVTTLEIYNPETVEKLTLRGGTNSVIIGKVKCINLANQNLGSIVVFDENESVTIKDDTFFMGNGSVFSATILKTKEIVVDLNQSYNLTLFVAKEKTERIVINKSLAPYVTINYEGNDSEWANVDVVDENGNTLSKTANLNKTITSAQ